MNFRPCIDLHKGKVKQIVGATLDESENGALVTNFETAKPAAEYARMYRRDGLRGGHVIMLGPGNEQAAKDALGAYPGGLHVGGGINPDNAAVFLDAGASHVIVTSFAFRDGRVDWERLGRMRDCVGKQRLVLDVSCKRRGDSYFVVTDRWTRSTDEALSRDLFGELSAYCDEFLVHAAEIEGMQGGVDETLVRLLATASPLPLTYAGGIRSIDDLERVRALGYDRIDATVGSALDIFGGSLEYAQVVEWHKSQR